MPSIDKPDSHLTTVKWRFPSVHPEGRKFTLIAAVLTLVTYSLVSHFLGWLLVMVTHTVMLTSVSLSNPDKSINGQTQTGISIYPSLHLASS